MQVLHNHQELGGDVILEPSATSKGLYVGELPRLQQPCASKESSSVLFCIATCSSSCLSRDLDLNKSLLP